ncbi:MAG: HAD family hydrolase [Oscillospiraceae bacterium]|nr:HAD family hydrolase [Oscillospiraceae bacterium]
MSQIKACIFDLDGTLTDTIRAIAHFGNTALAAYGMDGVSIEDYKIYVGDGRDKLIHRLLKARNADTPEMFRNVCAVYNENYEKDWLYDTNVYDGIRELLERLKENGVKIAVCSNKPDNVVRFVLDSFFGKDYFDAVSGIIDGMPTKPDPYTALKIAESLNVKPEECLFLGDTNVDIFTAKNAGMTSVGVLWGFRTQTELVQAGADYIAPVPNVILQLV